MRKTFKLLLLMLLFILSFCMFVACNGTNDNSGDSSSISFKTLIVNENNVNGTVGNQIETYSFLDEIETSGKATYIVSLDLYGEQQVLSKIIPLNIGNNTVYIFEMINGETNRVFNVTIRRRPKYIVNFDVLNGTYINSQEIEETFTATAPETDPVRSGYVFDGWDFDFSTPIVKNQTIYAKWKANTDTPYKIEYYYENLDDNGYTLVNTTNLKGTTGTFVSTTPDVVEHFSLNSSKSILSGNINGNGSLALKVYYTRNKYIATTSVNNTKAGYVSNGGTIKYDKSVTLRATTNAGYTFLGWFNNDKLFCQDLICTFNINKDIELTAKWSANTNTKYKVEYYLQNLEDDRYSLDKTHSFETSGTTDKIATLTPKNIEHFTFIEHYSNKLSGNIDGSETLVLKAYYTRNKYTLSCNSDSIGEITNLGTYKYGTNAFISTAKVFLGYDFGWYSGDELLSNETTFNFTAEKDVVAKFEIKKEMTNLIFSSTTNSCTVTGVHDKTIKELLIPNYVTEILDGALKGCKQLEELTIPYVGEFFFNLFNEFLPTSLKSVTVENGIIRSSAFSTGCYNLTNITLGDNVTTIQSLSACNSLQVLKIGSGVNRIDGGAFDGCISLTNIIVDDNNLTYKSIDGNLFSKNGKTLIKYAVGKTLTSYNIPSSVTTISDDAFNTCKYLTSVIIASSVTSIGNSAFANCESLADIIIPNNVKTIDNDAFDNCTSLKSVILGNNLNYIGQSAFGNCKLLTSIVIPSSVTSIGSYAFYNCEQLISITFNDTSTWYRVMEYFEFQNKTGGTETSVTDSNTNANNIKSTYYYYNWYKL